VGAAGEPDSYVLRGYVTYARVGSELVILSIESPNQAPPLAVAEELMAAQVACLQATEVCEAVAVPEALRAAGLATPIAASATPQAT
jgi:hypothetical protein